MYLEYICRLVYFKLLKNGVSQYDVTYTTLKALLRHTKTILQTNKDFICHMSFFRKMLLMGGIIYKKVPH